MPKTTRTGPPNSRRSGRGLLFLLVLLACPPSLLAADNPPGPQDFAACASIDGPLQPDALHVLALPGEILAQADKNGSDIRLFDEAGHEVPRVILDNIIPERPERWVALEPEEYAEDEGASSILLAKPKGTGNIQELRLNVSGRNFQINAEVLASQDKKLWTSLAKGVLYDATASVGLRLVTLPFAPSDAPFFQLRLWDDKNALARATSLRKLDDGVRVETVQRGQILPFTIKDFLAKTEAKREGRVQTDEATVTAFTQASAHGQTTIAFTTALPVGKIRIEAGDPFYERRATVWVADDSAPTAPGRLQPGNTAASGPDREHFRLIGQGLLRNTRTLNQAPVEDTLACQPGKHDRWRVVIEDKDSPPLAVRSLRLIWTQPLVFFIPKAPTGYTLRVGLPKASPPVYDLARSITRDNWWTLSALPASLGPLTVLATQPRAGTPETLPSWLVTALILALSFGLGVWVVRLLRTPAGTNGDQP